MFQPLEHLCVALADNLGVNDTRIKLRPGAAKALDYVGKGNHTYLMLIGMGRHEVVKYHHVSNYAEKAEPDVIVVERSECCPKSFAICDTVNFVWTGPMLLEYLKEQKPWDAK